VRGEKEPRARLREPARRINRRADSARSLGETKIRSEAGRGKLTRAAGIRDNPRAAAVNSASERASEARDAPDNDTVFLAFR